MAQVKEITMFDVDHQGQDEEARPTRDRPLRRLMSSDAVTPSGR